jgi:mRNA interferase MazF
VPDKINGLDQDSAGNVLQIRSLSTQRFIDKIGVVSNQVMGELLAGLIISIDYSVDN